MEPWITIALSRLEAEHAESQKRCDEAHIAFTLAESERNSAIGRRNALYNLLNDFREYAKSKAKGGVS